MKKDDNEVVDSDDPELEFEEDNDDDENNMFMAGHTMVVHSPQELFQLISKLTGGSGPSQEEFNQMIGNQIEQSEQSEQIDGTPIDIEDSGVDVWGPAFRNDPRDAHVYKGRLTPMPRSVFDRVH